ncbi:recombinase family protein [Methylibium rhizosphaerae]|uniref:recombinase family protein n=1 Tax=Methylibium rhizosphaerae TaxID=2570323 RepID=UPI0011277A98|nr:recombinase family protein [Methylibium rhizosphaerae]
MARIAYYRVSTADQSIDAQRHAMGGGFDEEFEDHGVSGATPAVQRPGFAKLLAYIRKGDELHVYAVDRLGRDAIDVQTTVRDLLTKGVAVEIRGLGRIAKGAGEIIISVLAQIADMERQRIAERTAAGREKARESLAATGKTHKGKTSLGRPMEGDPREVAAWRFQQGASIAQTAEHFGLSTATVKRYCLQAVETMGVAA